MSFALASIDWRKFNAVSVIALGAVLLFSRSNNTKPESTGPKPLLMTDRSAKDGKHGSRTQSTDGRQGRPDPDAHSRRMADRLGAATSRGLEPIPILRGILDEKTSSAADRVLACHKLALHGSGEAMQALFDAIATETDSGIKEQMCESLDLLTNEEGIMALASVAVATDDLLVLQAVEDCLSRCSTPDTVAYLAELHGEFSHDPVVAGRVCSMLAGVHSPQATQALAGLLSSDTPEDLFRSAALALSKFPGRDAARELVNATHRSLPLEHMAALREVITSSVEPEHFSVFRDEASETRTDYWLSTFSQALERDLSQ